MQRGLILLFFLSATSISAQLNSIIFEDGKVHTQRLFEDTLALSEYVSKLQKNHIENGYFFSNVDSVKKKERLHVFLHKGSQFNSKVTIDGELRKNPSKLISKTIKEYSSSGYPFVHVRLDSLSLSKDLLEATIHVEEGPKIVYDSTFFFQPIKTSKKYIYQLLDIEPGTLFNESSYSVISQKVSRNSFLEIKRPVDISFQKNRARIFLDLEENQTNTFQGVLGLQQGQGATTQVIGSLDLNIDNLFSSGKELSFFWERFGENSQRLNLFYLHPFFLESKISPTFSFDLLKQDSIFLVRSTGLGINTFISPKMNLSVQFQRTSGSLLSNDEGAIANLGIADYDRNTYQLELKEGFYEKLMGFRKGAFWRVSLGAGKKNIKTNLSVSDSYYDTMQLSTNFLQSEADFAYQLKVRKRQAFFHHLSAGLIRNSELLANELYRPGGLSTIRGFNEKFFFADQYIMSRMEFRSFFESNSYLYILYDQLIYKRSSFHDLPFGIGVGFALATSSGQFSFVLAAGKSKNQEVDLSGIKAHFGYVARF